MKVVLNLDDFSVVNNHLDLLLKLKEHFLGYFYVQEAASMIPPLILNPKDGAPTIKGR